MSDTKLITKEKVTWEVLRQEGLKYLEEITGHIWTDFKVHDPGVTIFELLCYAITDLESRLLNNINDILARKDKDKKDFFTPREILTINPVTINDYRKLLIDIPGVKNAWLVPAKDIEPSLYFDKDNNALLYDYASGSERIILNGLYRVFIEKDEDVTDEEILRQEVENKLFTHRNLGEEFIEVRIMEQETISVFTDIEISDDADANELMAKIYHDLKNFISPRIKQYSLKRMLVNGRKIDEIFNGPQLNNGFIDDDELGSGEKRKELHTSDLIRIIMDNEEVVDVKNLFISNIPLPDMSDKKEWALPLDDTKALVMEEFNSTKIRFFKNEILCPLNSNEISTKINQIIEKEKRDIYDSNVLDLDVPTGNVLDLTSFEPLTYKLPSFYGVSEAGLPSSASVKRNAQAMQLRAYILFFEQILINYFKQIESFKNLYSFKQETENILRTYFSQKLPESIWKDELVTENDMNGIFEYNEDVLTESVLNTENAFKRKNRILNHLLAQFNEKFADYAFFGYKYNMLINIESDDKMKYFLKAKAGFLKNYPALSRNRNRAYNFVNYDGITSFADGLKELIAYKLGLDIHNESGGSTEEFNNFFIVEHILLRPDGKQILDFICSEKIKLNHQPDPYSYKLSFVISKRAGRFGNSKFRELVYSTIDNETPAHMSYEIFEFNSEEMNKFRNTFKSFLSELKDIKTGNMDCYNSYRNKLIDLLGIGRIKLPILHLDASDVYGDGTIPGHGIDISGWKDLSRNNNNGSPKNNSKIYYLEKDGTQGPFLEFGKRARIMIKLWDELENKSLLQDDFTIAIVFKVNTAKDKDDVFFDLISDNNSAVDKGFSLRFTGNGLISGSIDKYRVEVDSTTGTSHIAIFTKDKDSGKIALYIDGVLAVYNEMEDEDIDAFNESITLGPAADDNATAFISEVIMLDSVITGSRKRKLEEYLAKKWYVALSSISSISMPVLHLDANSYESVELNEKTNKIIYWNDLTLKSYKLTGTTGSIQPEYIFEDINKLPAAGFLGGSFKISNPVQSNIISEKFSIAVLFKSDLNQGSLISGKISLTGEEKVFNVSIENKGKIAVFLGDNSVKIDISENETHFIILTGNLDETDEELELSINLDGKSFIKDKFKNISSFNLKDEDLIISGKDNNEDNFIGSIGEIVIYGESLSLWQQQRLEKYFSEKWAVDITGVNKVIAPVLHLDASKLADVIDQDNSPILDSEKRVYRWIDRSNFANEVIQPTSSRRPLYDIQGINELGAIEFSQEKISDQDFYEDSMITDRVIKDDFTIIVVFNPDHQFYLAEKDTLDKNKYIVDEYDIDIDQDSQWTDGAALLDADCSGQYNDFGISIGRSNKKLVVMGGIGDKLKDDHTIKSQELNFNDSYFITFTRLKKTGEVKLFINGLLHSEADLKDNVILNASRYIKIGAFSSEGYGFHGNIGEVIILDTVLSDELQRLVENYISVKWHIPIVTVPVDNTNLVLHLDASNTNSIIRDQDNIVSEWTDTGDINIIAEQTDSVNQPLYVYDGMNSKPVIRFNNNFLNVTPDTGSYENFTIALVLNPLSTGNILPGWNYGAGIIDCYTGDDTFVDFGVSINKDSELSVRIGTDTNSKTSLLNEPQIVMITMENSSQVNMFLNSLKAGKEIITVSGNELTGQKEFSIGAIHKITDQEVSKGYFHGDIAELILFNRTLTIYEIQDIERYLSMKWYIDISGINKIEKPVLHLDSSRVNSVKVGTNNKVSKWLDINGHSYNAVQDNPDKQPVYTVDINKWNGYGVLHFNDNDKTCLTLPGVIENDFTIIIVYKAETIQDQSGYKPVASDSFMRINGINKDLCQTICDELKANNFIDGNGCVMDAFNPSQSGFTLNLSANTIVDLVELLKSQIIQVISSCKSNRITVSRYLFVDIGGITNENSTEIWTLLQTNDYLDDRGSILDRFNPDDSAFILDIDLDEIAEKIIINILLAEKWFEGTGLFDGNCPGELADFSKRDFGILVNDNNLIAGIGVPGEGDFKIEVSSEINKEHIVVFTRIKETGENKLYIDDNSYIMKRIAQDVSLKDSKTITIGAVNTGGNYFNGDIAEIIVLDKVPAKEKIQEIQKYLSKKWGLGLFQVLTDE